MANMPYVYFAHSMLDYNTKLEAEVRSTLESYIDKDLKLICPNRDLSATLGKDMYRYLAFVKTCALVIVLEHNKYIGHGVFDEVNTAIRSKIPVFVFRDSNLVPVTGTMVNDPNDWRFKYAKLVTSDVEHAKNAETIVT